MLLSHPAEPKTKPRKVEAGAAGGYIRNVNQGHTMPWLLYARE